MIFNLEFFEGKNAGGSVILVLRESCDAERC